MISYLIDMLGLNKQNKFTGKEKLFLEVIIYQWVYREIVKECTVDDTLQKYILEEKGCMIDGYIIRKLVNDLIINREYSIEGLAHYTGFPEDVIYDISAGLNNDPTITLSNKIIELHFIARREFYMKFLEKIPWAS